MRTVRKWSNMPSRTLPSPEWLRVPASGPPFTLRGWATVAIVAAGTVAGILFGTPATNAVVAPGVVVLAVALWQVQTLERPSVTRRAPREGAIGQTRAVTITMDDPPHRLGRIVDGVGGGLSAEGHGRSVPLDRPFTYELTLERRGEHELGPIRVQVTDLLGLAERTFRYPDAWTVTVKPRILPLKVGSLKRLARLSDLRIEPERHEFDRLREYHPTDSLRDVHWKTSAKRPDVDFVVKQFVKESDRGTVKLSGEAESGSDDALADAMASLAVALVDAGVRVGVTTEAGSVEPIEHPEAVDDILAHLATIGPGSPETREAIHFESRGTSLGEVRVRMGDRHLAMEDLIATVGGPADGAAKMPVSRRAPGVAD